MAFLLLQKSFIHDAVQMLFKVLFYLFFCHLFVTVDLFKTFR